LFVGEHSIPPIAYHSWSPFEPVEKLKLGRSFEEANGEWWALVIKKRYNIPGDQRTFIVSIAMTGCRKDGKAPRTCPSDFGTSRHSGRPALVLIRPWGSARTPNRSLSQPCRASVLTRPAPSRQAFVEAEHAVDHWPDRAGIDQLGYSDAEVQSWADELEHERGRYVSDVFA
jgi:hypothetical protein